ncbi:hypothetical protein JCM19235_908 [Vibrio maritimus]|uniref:Uncharacterized protein n=1 Tax=Vibrio maritimus TaxID=990268 RepID=A0A090SJF7_9VIBR|nr:hypothetical protein JCM19235_908 [Vibrio maritimus]
MRYVRVSPNDKQALKTYISDLARIDQDNLAALSSTPTG